MPNHSFIKNLFLYIPIKLIPAATGILLIGYLFKNFSSQDYAYYSIVVASGMITSQLSSGWISNSIIFHYNPTGHNHSLFSNSVLLSIMCSTLASILVVVALLFILPTTISILVWPLCASQALFTALTSCGQASFQVRQQLHAVLTQTTIQIGTLVTLFSLNHTSVHSAIASITLGYLGGSIILYRSTFNKPNHNNSTRLLSALIDVFKASWSYSSTLIIWSAGMLLAVSVDRYSIGFFKLPGSGGYLSVKDLFIGAGGLISMPLLMLVHPLIFRTFKTSHYAHDVIEESIRVITLIFALGWGAIWVFGLPLFSTLTSKQLDVSSGVAFMLYLSTAVNAVAIYAQKRHEVHKKIAHLAKLSALSALTSGIGAVMGGVYGSLYGVALGALVGPVIYFVIILISIRKKLSFSRSLIQPIVIGGVISGLAIYITPLSERLAPTYDAMLLATVSTTIYCTVSGLLVYQCVLWYRFR